jgi:hypothetical protein
MTIVYAAMICGLIAVVYGIITSRQILAASPGNEKMQDIAAAIAEGAKAYPPRPISAANIAPSPLSASSSQRSSPIFSASSRPPASRSARSCRA